ncbi:NAD(P)-binding protein [Microbacterium sp. SYP-A9085]|uniref:flavin-containing monooxygenase n=1 Tax=Microbacterium sp. SYP-A9085 TaxID=2664454 RepID=UPI00129BA907|nr:NAD(P)/FAD-dependent oxidoreductase [Microbacterium sp. SYP-A9085]MRH28051.1 NAD(P)-binding protein [Microbacterium sp. SYP-A9085]
MSAPDGSADPQSPLDVVVIGAGFGGLYATYRLAASGRRFRVFEKAPDVGGTWFYNRYPGARCDVDSLQYSYSFSDDLQQEWEWTERFAGQPEILRYIRHVAQRFDLYRHISFDTRVTSVVWDDAARCWEVSTDRGDTVRATWVVTAVGCLSTPKEPEIDGLADFAGESYYTNSWPHDEPDFRGKRVGVIGTGSSGIQSIPLIAETAAEVTVYQRTPAYTMPAMNRPLEPDEVVAHKAQYAQHRAQERGSRSGTLVVGHTDPALAASDQERRRRFEECWRAGSFGCALVSFSDIVTHRDANDHLVDFLQEKVHAIVEDQEVASALASWEYPFGSRRVCLDTDYYATFNAPHVHLVDVKRDPIIAVTPGGVRTQSGERAHDVIVYATGFDAFTGTLFRLGIRGRDGVRLADAWADGPRTYLGLQTAGFPNLFVVVGPQSPSLVVNVVRAIEQHVDWIMDALDHADAHGIGVVEADPAAQDDWVDHVAEVGHATLYPVADSYMTNANIPGKPRVFMPYLGGFGAYGERIAQVAAQGYPGFVLSA